MPNTRATKDDIANLIKGKASKNKVGSRTVPHRLNKIELIKFEKATKLGFLKYNSKTRLALINSFEEYQLASKNLSVKVNTDLFQIEIISLDPEILNQFSDYKKVNSNYIIKQSNKQDLKQELSTIFTKITF